MSSDSETWEDTLPCCSIEADHHASTTTHLQQPPEPCLSQDESHSEPDHQRKSNDGRRAPISSGPAENLRHGEGSSKSAGGDPRHLPETKPLNISRKPRDDGPSITTPRKTQDNSGKPENRIEYNPLTTSSDPTQDRNPSNRSRNRPRSQKPREPGFSNSVSRPRKGSKNFPSIPSQNTSSSSGGPRLQYPPESQAFYSQELDEPPSISSVQTEERNQYTYAQTHPQTQKPRVTRVSFSERQTFSNDNIPQSHAEHFKTSIPLQDQGLDRSADAGRPDTRPNLIHGTPSQLDTQYVNMLLALDDIPQLHKILAGFFNWILLAGFILFPGTFTSLQNLGGSSGVAQLLVHQVTRISLFVIAWLCTGIGAIGMLWLWWRWRKNYVWALNKIFLPGALNSLAGFISTMANVFGAQHGELSTTSKVTIIVTAGSTGILGILTLIYTFWLVKRVKSRHDSAVGKSRTGKHGEGVTDLSKRKIDV